MTETTTEHSCTARCEGCGQVETVGCETGLCSVCMHAEYVEHRGWNDVADVVPEPTGFSYCPACGDRIAPIDVAYGDVYCDSLCSDTHFARLAGPYGVAIEDVEPF